MTQAGAYRIGVDIGGSKLSVALVNDQLEIVKKYYRKISGLGREDLFDLVKELIQRALQEAGKASVRGIGLGIPGKVDRDRGIAVYQMMIPWANFPIVDRLEESFDLPIRIDNDVAVAALAEYQLAQRDPEETFSYVTVSTGISSQSFVHGQMIRGSGFAGETALVPVSYRNLECLVQHLASGTGIQDRGRQLLDRPDLATVDIFNLAQAGDRQAQEVIQEGAEVLAWSLYQIICVLDPAEIVLGGSVILEQAGYLQACKEALEPMLFPDQAHVLDHISASSLGENNGLLGAAALID
ncbi:ROK family protein [Aerococcus sp. UMB1112A]|uniref:ROK family protein n=1 Tax=Aerococcus sp. UMB1112A TaxID=3050609 RepID=UPI00254DC164|nr:ROK family protein [Aerococcus sp. UMB1112A]MDK8502577.1 ROK family protein [Aerococcus sp. UMB1112A]